MNRFWEDIIEPLCKECGIKKIVEVGAQNGYQTQKLIEYCKNIRGGQVSSIDPYPNFEWKEWEEKNTGCFKMYCDLSLNILSTLVDYELILIDGDHNWYTVYHELKLIKQNMKERMPIIILHDIGWPYDRRDLYYDPDTIPDEYKNPYEKNGISPFETNLSSVGINSHLYNAIDYGTEKNGVLTAIEDFLGENSNLRFVKIECISGLGIIYADEYSEKLKKVLCVDNLLSLLKTVEKERINEFYTRKKDKAKYNEEKKNILNKMNKLDMKFERLNEQISAMSVEKVDLNNKILELQKAFDNSEIKAKELLVDKLKYQNAYEVSENTVREKELYIQDIEERCRQRELTIREIEKEYCVLKQEYQEMENSLKIECENYKQEILKNELTITKMNEEIRISSGNFKAKSDELVEYKRMYKQVTCSMRYYAGTIFVEAFQSPKKFILAPARMIVLAIRYFKGKKLRSR